MENLLTNTIKNNVKGDRYIWFIVILLVIFSILGIYSSTSTLAVKQQGFTEIFVLKHIAIALVGLGIMYISHLLNFRYYSRLSQLFLYASIPLLLYTLYKGTATNEATRWIMIPVANITFQTSDFAKLALIMYLARTLARFQDQIKTWQAFASAMWPVAVVCFLIMLDNFSTAAILGATSLLLMFIGRIHFKFIAITLITGLLGGALVIFLGSEIGIKRAQTWKNRITSYSNDSTEVYQNMQANIAIATGGIVGKGPGKSTQRNFLPEAYSDFIYAIILEEYGLPGGIFILLLYVGLLYRVILLVKQSPRAFGALLALGLGFSLTIQALVNMAVAVGLFPVTGQTLPFVSMGGTSLIFSSIAIGIILSVSRDAEMQASDAEMDQPLNPAPAYGN